MTDTDLICSNCKITATWTSTFENQKYYLINMSVPKNGVMTCNEIIMKQVLK